MNIHIMQIQCQFWEKKKNSSSSMGYRKTALCKIRKLAQSREWLVKISNGSQCSHLKEAELS